MLTEARRRVLREVARDYDYATFLLDATAAVNARKRKRMIFRLQRELHTLKDKRAALLGIFFKPNTDDFREALSLAKACALDAPPTFSTAMLSGASSKARGAVHDSRVCRLAKKVLLKGVCHPTPSS